MATKRYTVRAETDAEDDFRRAFLYYAQIDHSYGNHPVLVDAFVIEYLDFCERLANNPLQFPPFEEYRKAYFSKRFRYLAIFQVDQEKRLVSIKALRGPGQNITLPRV